MRPGLPLCLCGIVEGEGERDGSGPGSIPPSAQEGRKHLLLDNKVFQIGIAVFAVCVRCQEGLLKSSKCHWKYRREAGEGGMLVTLPS